MDEKDLNKIKVAEAKQELETAPKTSLWDKLKNFLEDKLNVL